MVNPLKLREMISLASFEKGRGRVSMEICRYYRSDYVGLQLIRTFFLTTVGLVLAAGLVIAGNLEAILDLLVYLDIGRVLWEIAAGYLILLVLSLTVTWFLSRRRWNKARRDRQDYLLHLTDLRDLTEEPYDL